MNLIAMSQRVEVIAGRQERRDALEQTWCRFLREAGFLPLILPNCLEVAKELVERLSPQGYLLTGGNDLAILGGSVPERDEVESFLFQRACRQKQPLIGVCRGMQFLLHFFGVSLNLVKDHVACEHLIFLSGRKRLVNSFHSYGAKASCEPLEVIAQGEDGVIEAIRHPSLPLMGLMWHPERFSPFQTEDLILFREHFSRRP